MMWKPNPIGYYLMACYAYEVLNDPIMPDGEFDQLGKEIAADWDFFDHPHQQYIDPKSCAFTSAVTVPYERLPLTVLTAAHHLTGTPFSQSPVYAKAMAALEERVQEKHTPQELLDIL